MYGIYANIWGILMVNVTIYTIHGSYGLYMVSLVFPIFRQISSWMPRGCRLDPGAPGIKAATGTDLSGKVF